VFSTLTSQCPDLFIITMISEHIVDNSWPVWTSSSGSGRYSQELGAVWQCLILAFDLAVCVQESDIDVA
jgi:hypothetical protein